jgi:tRNA G18 (ribose-2'-O)-methylase SpoU
VLHHDTVAAFAEWARAARLPVIGIDILPGAEPVEAADLPAQCVLLFGQEGPGLSPEAQDVCERILAISQFGSTRSINVGVASGIVMHAWVRRHVLRRGGDGRRGAVGGGRYDRDHDDKEVR